MNENMPYLFSQAAEDWLAYNLPELKYSSFVRYTNILNKQLLPAFADTPVSEITRERVIHFRGQLLEQPGEEKTGLAPNTVALVFSVLRRILAFAHVEKGYQVADLSKITIRQSAMPLRVFSMTEQRRLNQYLRKATKTSDVGILLTLYTGLRIGEVCALKWYDISLENRTIHVHQTMQRIQTFQEPLRTKVIITSPKSPCSIRYIPIPDFLYKFLFLHRKKPECFLLTGCPIRYMEPRHLSYRFAHILKSCDIHDATFHTLRHTFATRCIEQGVDIKTLSEILGHANVNITLNRYVHPSMDFKRKNMDKLSGLFEDCL